MSPPNCKIINFSPDSCEWVKELLLEGSEGGSIWNISTKYYKANVAIDLLDHKEITEEGNGFEDTEAVIFHCDTSVVCLESCNRVWQRIKEHFPSVCLFLVKSASDENLSEGEATRTAILEWCLANQFELVETETPEEDEDEIDDFGEREGKTRIISALKAHTWSNLELVEEGAGVGRQLGGEAQSLGANGGESEEIQLQTANDSDEDIDFEDLFSQLSKMKEISRNLSDHERKAYAEKVALAFYKSIGGGDSEEEEN